MTRRRPDASRKVRPDLPARFVRMQRFPYPMQTTVVHDFHPRSKNPATPSTPPDSDYVPRQARSPSALHPDRTPPECSRTRFSSLPVPPATQCPDCRPQRPKRSLCRSADTTDRSTDGINSIPKNWCCGKDCRNYNCFRGRMIQAKTDAKNSLCFKTLIFIHYERIFPTGRTKAEMLGRGCPDSALVRRLLE